MNTIMNDSVECVSYEDECRGENEFVERVAEYVETLYAVALQLTRDPQRAEDLVHQTLATALAGREAFEDGMYLKSWLLTILRKTFIKPDNDSRELGDCSGKNDGSLSYFLDLKQCSSFLLALTA